MPSSQVTHLMMEGTLVPMDMQEQPVRRLEESNENCSTTAQKGDSLRLFGCCLEETDYILQVCAGTSDLSGTRSWLRFDSECMRLCKELEDRCREL